ncbi:hypothetical protein GE09DRAFT_1091495 [Coniochaeta sp. 2T2.1]|nr:hypothetical protein GE09DRAFT_1091495 [Coniochaeta sp. 2T2.1]
MVYFSSRLSCLLICLYGLSQAEKDPIMKDGFYASNFGNGMISGRNAQGPWGMNLSEFEPYVQDVEGESNATTYINVPGPNASYAYPGADHLNNQQYPFTLGVVVTADIPATNVTDGTLSGVTDEDRAKFFTGSRVGFQVPTLVANITGRSRPDNSSAPYTNWDLCVFTWDFSFVYNATYPYKFREDDGNCTSIVSEQCVKDMENEAVENYRKRDRQCQCPTVAKLSSCYEDSLFAKLGCVAHTFNYTDVQQWPEGNYPTYIYGGPFHDKGNITAYNETGSLSWPVMTLWGRWPTEVYQGNGSSPPTSDKAKLTCIRPMEGRGSGNIPGIPSTSGAGSRSVALGLLWLVAGLSFVFLC